VTSAIILWLFVINLGAIVPDVGRREEYSHAARWLR
jgi:hypothetical protein